MAAQPTLASAIQIGNPVSVKKAIRTLQRYNGIVEQATRRGTRGRVGRRGSYRSVQLSAHGRRARGAVEAGQARRRDEVRSRRGDLDGERAEVHGLQDAVPRRHAAGHYADARAIGRWSCRTNTTRCGQAIDPSFDSRPSVATIIVASGVLRSSPRRWERSAHISDQRGGVGRKADFIAAAPCSIIPSMNDAASCGRKSAVHTSVAVDSVAVRQHLSGRRCSASTDRPRPTRRAAAAARRSRRSARGSSCRSRT